MKRFWKTVGVESRDDGPFPFLPLPRSDRLGAHLLIHTGKIAIMLDQRTLKSPGGVPLLVGKEHLPVALCIADEWENQTAVLKQHSLPMVRIALPSFSRSSAAD